MPRRALYRACVTAQACGAFFLAWGLFKLDHVHLEITLVLVFAAFNQQPLCQVLFLAIRLRGQPMVIHIVGVHALIVRGFGARTSY